MVSYKSKIETWVKSNKDNLPLLEVIQMWYWNPSSWRIRKNQEIFYKEATKNLQLRYDPHEISSALLELERFIDTFNHIQYRNFERAIEDAYISHVLDPLWERIENLVHETEWFGPTLLILGDYFDIEDIWNEPRGITTAQKREIEKHLAQFPVSSSVRFEDLVKVGLFYEMTWRKKNGEKQKRYVQPYAWEFSEIMILQNEKLKSQDYRTDDSVKIVDVQSIVGSGDLHLIPYDSFEMGREALSAALTKSSGFLNVQDNFLNRHTLQLLDRIVPANVSIQILTELADWKIRKTHHIRRWVAIAEALMDIQKRRPHFYIRTNKKNFLHDRILNSETYTCALTTSIKDVGGSKTCLIIYLGKSISDELEREFKSIWNARDTYEITPLLIYDTISRSKRRMER